MVAQENHLILGTSFYEPPYFYQSRNLLGVEIEKANCRKHAIFGISVDLRI